MNRYIYIYIYICIYENIYIYIFKQVYVWHKALSQPYVCGQWVRGQWMCLSIQCNGKIAKNKRVFDDWATRSFNDSERYFSQRQFTDVFNYTIQALDGWSPGGGYSYYLDFTNADFTLARSPPQLS